MQHLWTRSPIWTKAQRKPALAREFCGRNMLFVIRILARERVMG